MLIMAPTPRPLRCPLLGPVAVVQPTAPQQKKDRGHPCPLVGTIPQTVILGLLGWLENLRSSNGCSYRQCGMILWQSYTLRTPSPAPGCLFGGLG